MYSKEKIYKLQLKTGIYYTGQIVEEDQKLIKINTIRNETIIINKEEIIQSLEIGEVENGN